MAFDRSNLYARTNWKLITTLVIMASAFIVVGFLAAFSPPVLAAIAGFSFYGLTPFAVFGVWAASGIGGLIGASLLSGLLAAAAVAVSAAVLKLIYTITCALDNAIIPKEDEYNIYDELDESEIELDELEGSRKKMAGMGGKKARKDGCGCFGDSENDKSFDSPLSKSKSKSKTISDSDDTKSDDPDPASAHSTSSTV